MEKEASAKELEIFKLEMCKKCLESEFLERRIQGIRDLNTIIKNNTIFNHKQFEATFLVQWMTEHNIFDIIWVSKRTHAQLVERSNDIWRLLLKEKLMTTEHLQMFWELTLIPGYKSVVYEIIKENCFYLMEE